MVQISIFIVAIDFLSPDRSHVFLPPGTTWHCSLVASVNTVLGRPDRLVLKNFCTQPPVPVGVWAECIHVSFHAPAKCSEGGIWRLFDTPRMSRRYLRRALVGCRGFYREGGVSLTTIGYVSGQLFLWPFQPTRFESDAISRNGPCTWGINL